MRPNRYPDVTKPGRSESSRKIFCPVSENGFTLLELIIVIFLITLLTSLSLPFFARSLPSSRFDATVRDVVSTIRRARILSQVNNERQTIFIDLDSKYYGIEGYGSKNIPSGINIMVIDPFLGEVRDGKHLIAFQPSWGMDIDTIVLWNDKRTARIEMDPVVGAVVVK